MDTTIFGALKWRHMSVLNHRMFDCVINSYFSLITKKTSNPALSLRWRHNGRDIVSNYQPHDCLLSRLFRRRSKLTSKLRVTGLCAGNSPGTGEFPAQMASNAENVSIWWRHHVVSKVLREYNNAHRWITSTKASYAESFSTSWLLHVVLSTVHTGSL